MGIFFIVISGGEPFFSQNMLRVFDTHPDVAFLVFTHGGLLDREMVDRLARWGNVLPCISIEGFEQQTDERRGKGHYRRVMEAMDQLREAGLLFGYSATLTQENADLITSSRFVDTMIERGCSVGWYFHYIPIGREPRVELMPTPEQRDKLRRAIAEFRATKPMLFGDFHNDGPVVGGCIAAGRKYLHINSHGDIEPCVFFHYAEHNIRQTPLHVALRSPFFKAIRAGQDGNPNLLRPCTLIDHPEISRGAIACSCASPTHEGAESLFTSLSREIDQYAEHYGAIADVAWKEMVERQAKSRSC
jgi:MoaA/NifB/PqqE/SkfB family radical SAM enzyme